MRGKPAIPACSGSLPRRALNVRNHRYTLPRDAPYAGESWDPAVALVSVDGEVLTVCGVGGRLGGDRCHRDGPGRRPGDADLAITVTSPEAVWYVPPASDPVRQGFVRAW